MSRTTRIGMGLLAFAMLATRGFVRAEDPVDKPSEPPTYTYPWADGIGVFNACCDPRHGGCGGTWTVLAETMFLRRADGGNQPLIVEQTGRVVNAEDLGFNHQAVPRLTLMYQDCCSCWGFDVGFLGLDSWHTRGQGGGDVSANLVGPGIPFTSTAPNTTFQVDYGTDLYSAEFNLRHQYHPCVSVLAGFRWIELDDELRGSHVTPSVQQLYRLSAANKMYGLQVGADAALLSQRWYRLDLVSRAGIMANHVDLDASSPITGSIGGLVSSVAADEDHTSFVGELGLRGVARLCGGLSAYGGYHLMWLDGVALAPQQLSRTSLRAPGSASIDTSSTLFMHGATVGLEYQF